MCSKKHYKRDTPVELREKRMSFATLYFHRFVMIYATYIHSILLMYLKEQISTVNENSELSLWGE